MTVPRRRSTKSEAQTPALVAILTVFVVLVIYLATVTDDTPPNVHSKKEPSPSLRATVATKRKQLRSALESLTSQHMPMRLYKLRETNQIVGERLPEIKAGTETVEEILHGVSDVSNKPPMKFEEIRDYLEGWIHQLHDTLVEAKHSTYQGIWQSYHDLAVKTLYPWDREYLQRMPPRRDDGSIFLSLATYRDENCFNTVSQAYKKAKHPDKLFIGLIQQNCHSDCISGILTGGKTEPVEPDQDCYKAFCETDDGKRHCEAGRVRLLDIDEPESLGPYAARYFASKLWYGEQWFMQTDAHMTFAQDWDAISVEMLKKAPSKKPVLSHYPPGHTSNLDAMAGIPASRLCGPVFATSDLESQIIRLEGANKYDKTYNDVPRFAPFTAAGYFVAHSGKSFVISIKSTGCRSVLTHQWLFQTFSARFHSIRSFPGSLWVKRSSCRHVYGLQDTISSLRVDLLLGTSTSDVTSQSFGSRCIGRLRLASTIHFR